jgi:hypothetical protein
MSPKWRIFQNVVVGVAIVTGLLAWYGRHLKLGTRLAISDQESIRYAGTATEADAKALGAALKEEGYFDGSGNKDVILNKGDDGTEISFVVKWGAWEDAETVTAFQTVGEAIAMSVGGPPLTVALMDDDLDTHREIEIQTARVRHPFSDVESVYYRTPATREQAQSLGEGLKTAGYFDGSAPAMVLLEPEGDGFSVSFAVQEGKWDDSDVAEAMRSIGAAVAPSLGGKPVKVKLMDSQGTVHRTLD